MSSQSDHSHLGPGDSLSLHSAATARIVTVAQRPQPRCMMNSRAVRRQMLVVEVQCGIPSKHVSVSLKCMRLQLRDIRVGCFVTCIRGGKKRLTDAAVGHIIHQREVKSSRSRKPLIASYLPELDFSGCVSPAIGGSVAPSSSRNKLLPCA